MRIALIGNPNSGKTTLFNELTKANQKIGNWSGVTIEKKEGTLFGNRDIKIIDLPGIYSLNPLSEDEKITCAYLAEEGADVIINVIDSAQLERSLMLTLQLLEVGIPVVVALNMEDELKRNGVKLNAAAIKTALWVPVISVSARKNHNIDVLIEIAIAEGTKANSPKFVATGKNFEEKSAYRKQFIKSRIASFRTKSYSKGQDLTAKIDSILLDKWLALPVFAVVIWLMYFVSIQLIGRQGARLGGMLEEAIAIRLAKFLTSIGVADWLLSLIIDGILKGLSAVFCFLPQIMALFLCISIIEGCGYMARIAVIMDRLFARFGLSGKSFIPMIIGCGCSVPAIMSAKTVENEAERRATIMLTPFVPCSAKLPVFALIAGSVMPNCPFAAPSMYFLGIFMVILGALILKHFRPKDCKNGTFVIELPQYRLPNAKNVTIELWDKLKGFVVRAGSIILPASILLWFLQTFDYHLQMVQIEDSILSYIGRSVAWIFAPLGFGNWQTSIAIISGMFAKETIVAAFGVILGESADGLAVALSGLFSPHAALAFMAFTLLAAPCVAAIAASHKELGNAKLTLKALVFQCGIAYFVALLINQIGNLLS